MCVCIVYIFQTFAGMNGIHVFVSHIHIIRWPISLNCESVTRSNCRLSVMVLSLVIECYVCVYILLYMLAEIYYNVFAGMNACFQYQ